MFLFQPKLNNIINWVIDFVLPFNFVCVCIFFLLSFACCPCRFAFEILFKKKNVCFYIRLCDCIGIKLLVLWQKSRLCFQLKWLQSEIFRTYDCWIVEGIMQLNFFSFSFSFSVFFLILLLSLLNIIAEEEKEEKKKLVLHSIQFNVTN